MKVNFNTFSMPHCNTVNRAQTPNFKAKLLGELPACVTDPDDREAITKHIERKLGRGCHIILEPSKIEGRENCGHLSPRGERSDGTGRYRNGGSVTSYHKVGGESVGYQSLGSSTDLIDFGAPVDQVKKNINAAWDEICWYGSNVPIGHGSGYGLFGLAGDGDY